MTGYAESLSFHEGCIYFVGKDPPYIYNTSGRMTWTNSFIGSDNPYWRGQVARGVNATTAAFGIERDRVRIVGTGYLSFKLPGINGNKQSDLRMEVDSGAICKNYQPTVPSTISTTKVDRLAREEFVSAYRELRTAFQGGVFLGELMQTVRMIKNPAKHLRVGLSGYVADVKKRLKMGNPKGSNSRHRRIVSDTWLEYTFGWRPLIRDIHDACKLATAHPFVAMEKINEVNGEKYNGAAHNDQRTCPGAAVLVFRERTRDEYFRSVRYKGAVKAENSPPPFAEQLGVSWSNVLPTGWELIPYSFLVDYFANVGKVIEGISTGNIALAWGCKTVRVMSSTYYWVELDYKATRSALGSSNFHAGVNGSGHCLRFKDVERHAVGGVSVGLSDLSFKLPDSGTKFLNLLGLASMRFR